jgi:ribosomal protein S18 acetylase RimI-like enzyme
MLYRAAGADDVQAVALLHADSWRRSYRGMYSDEYLDHQADAERLATWSERFANRGPREFTTVAEHDGEVVGFVHTVLDDDPEWGSLLDNLHVRSDVKRGGIGTHLMAESARVVLEHSPGSGLFLFVLEPNIAAQRFYDARGGRCVGGDAEKVPGGAMVVALRYVWPDPARLLVPAR